ncbi:hypothetical protein [Pendulispora albinea]|uniref:Uncharacterized protein n=1 Tax=Pendulispora albinea TaxID=2741071 RepID=A0ABZ2M6I8_9BACT
MHKVQGSYDGKTANAGAQAEPGKVTVVRLAFESHDAPAPVAAIPPEKAWLSGMTGPETGKQGISRAIARL